MAHRKFSVIYLVKIKDPFEESLKYFILKYALQMIKLNKTKFKVQNVHQTLVSYFKITHKIDSRIKILSLNFQVQHFGRFMSQVLILMILLWLLKHSKMKLHLQNQIRNLEFLATHFTCSRLQ